MIETEEGIPYSEADPEVTIIQEANIEDSYRDRDDSRLKRSISQSTSPGRRPRVASKSPSRIKTYLSCRQFHHFAKYYPKKDMFCR